MATTPLVSLDEAKSQVFVAYEDDDLALDLLCQLATGIVLDYVGLDPVTGAARTWTTVTVPDPIKMAILLQIGELWAHRGDEEQTQTPADGYLSAHITRLLHRFRDPVVA